MTDLRRNDLRNVAIVAHVDHGKTTLVDAMLWQSGACTAHQADTGDVNERVMDRNDLEREKGLTSLAKNTAIRLRDENGNPVTVNIVDTPGHADFGGEVERGLSMVDGVVLLVDASEGPLPQTRFVLRKALAKRLPVILVVNKTDRSDARIAEVVDETYELFLELLEDSGMADEALDFPIVYSNGKTGQASLTRPADGTSPDSPDLAPLVKTLLDTIPAPVYDAEEPLRAQVTNLDASPYLGRLALLRIHSGEMKNGQQVAWCKVDGSISRVKITELLVTEGLDRTSAESAGPGDLVAIAGIEDIMIGDTLADPNDPRPLPPLTVDEPSISITIGINTSPLAGRDGQKLTASQVKSRLDRELVGNVSLRVLETDRPDVWEVQGRGELALAVLVELMRREGYELTVGKPEVVTREIDGKRCEPVERMSVDAPEEYVGVITQLLAMRKGRLEQMVNHGTGWVRMEYLIPARGLIGFRNRVPHRDTRHRPRAPRIRPLGTVARGAADSAYWVAGRRPPRDGGVVRAVQPPGARDTVRRARRGGIRGHDRRRKFAPRGPRRERLKGETSDQHAVLDRRRARASYPKAGAVARPGPRVSARRRVRRGHTERRPAAQSRPRCHIAPEAGPGQSVVTPSMAIVKRLRTRVGLSWARWAW